MNAEAILQSNIDYKQLVILMKNFLKRHTPLLMAASLITGCATSGDPRDPIEGFNRGVYKFNTTFDEYIFNPVATGYQTITPKFVDKGITNFFGNLSDVGNAVNNLLQFKVQHAASDVGRIVINSTIGLLGFMDVASSMDLKKHNEDFGQTMATWGIGAGPYIVLPILGPNTTRSSVGLLADSYVDPIMRISHIPTRNTVIALKFIDLRSDLLAVDALKDLLVEGVDEYDVVKDAYLQRREWLIYDGNPPIEEEFDDYDDEAFYNYEEDLTPSNS